MDAAALSTVLAASRVNWNTASRGALLVTHKRPLCASVIERQIDSPMPIPSVLVVNIGLNICSDRPCTNDVQIEAREKSRKCLADSVVVIDYTWPCVLIRRPH